MEEVKENTYLQLNEDYRITSDTRMNLIMSNRYETRLGKGRSAELSGEYSWKDIGYFGANLRSLIGRFNDVEFLKSFKDVERGQDIIEALQEMRTYLDEREQRIYEHVKEHVVLELKAVKDSSGDKIDK